MADLAQALSNLRPGAQWMLAGNTVNGLTWLDLQQSPPTEQEIQEELARLEVQYRDQQYQRDRIAAYPSIEQQLDMLYHLGYDGWRAKIDEVKQQFPKPTSE